MHGPESTDRARRTGVKLSVRRSRETVAAPAVVISASGDTVQEAPGAQLEFGVKLSRAAEHTVTVAYATADVEAEAGQGLRGDVGIRLTFEPGETKKTVTVTVLDDDHDEPARRR